MTDESYRPIILLLGPPGAGKGTQARFLHDTLAIPHIASGDLLRDHRRRGTSLGKAAQAYMDRGDLVPDRLVVEMVADRLDRDDARRGALLDGFPRTRSQAEIVDDHLAQRRSPVRAALYLEVSTDLLVDRIAGRWLCPGCQATYPGHIATPPGDGRCVACRDRLYQRADDRPDVVQHRIEVYLRETLPVVEHYAQRGLVAQIDGSRPIAAVRVTLCSSLGGVVRGRRHDHWYLYISHKFRADDGVPDWHGRTLCGQLVDSRSGRVRGSEDAFLVHPCRRCNLALRPRQGPILLLPASQRSDQSRDA